MSLPAAKLDLLPRIHAATGAILVALVGAFACGQVCGQDLEPRAYSNSPTGLSFAVGGYAYSKGSVNTDPALPVDNVSVEAHTAIFALATTLNVFGKSGKLDLIVPYSSLAAEGLVLGVRRERLVSDFGDPLFRFSVNLYGAPALTMEEFANYRQNLIIGASLRVSAPLGHYDEDKLVNIGANRWAFRPEIGISKAIGKFTIEVAPSMTYYTDNGDYLAGRTRRQEPIFSTQLHVSYTIAPSCWLALNGAYFVGGGTNVDAVENNDEIEGGRIGATLAVPLNRYHSLKVYAIRGFNAHRRADLDVIGIAWQVRWGGGF